MAPPASTNALAYPIQIKRRNLKQKQKKKRKEKEPFKKGSFSIPFFNLSWFNLISGGGGPIIAASPLPKSNNLLVHKNAIHC